MKTAAAAEGYIDTLPQDRRDALTELRGTIERTWPHAKLSIVRGMPTFHLDGHPFCAIANRKHYMVLYIMPYDLLRAFRNDLMVYDRGKSCIRFKRLDPATLDLFDRIIKYTGSQLSTSAHFDTNGRTEKNGKAR